MLSVLEADSATPGRSGLSFSRRAGLPPAYSQSVVAIYLRQHVTRWLILDGCIEARWPGPGPVSLGVFSMWGCGRREGSRGLRPYQSVARGATEAASEGPPGIKVPRASTVSRLYSCFIGQVLSPKGPLLQEPGVACASLRGPRTRPGAPGGGARDSLPCLPAVPPTPTFPSLHRQPFSDTLKPHLGLPGTFAAAQGGKLAFPLTQPQMPQTEYVICPAWDKVSTFSL